MVLWYFLVILSNFVSEPKVGQNMNRTKSDELYRKAVKLFPEGLNYPVRALNSVRGNPVFIEKGYESKITDIDASSMGKFSILHSELLERGIYLGPSGYEVSFLSSAHSKGDLDNTIQAFKESLDIAFE